MQKSFCFLHQIGLLDRNALLDIRADAVTQTSPLSVAPFARVRRVPRMLLVGDKHKKIGSTAEGHTQLKWEE